MQVQVSYDAYFGLTYSIQKTASGYLDRSCTIAATRFSVAWKIVPLHWISLVFFGSPLLMKIIGLCECFKLTRLGRHEPDIGESKVRTPFVKSRRKDTA